MALYGTFLYGSGQVYLAADSQAISNAIARAIGGTQAKAGHRYGLLKYGLKTYGLPPSAIAVSPYFYSGAQAGDGTGVANIKGCWSNRTFVPSELPVGVVLTKGFRQELGTRVEVQREDRSVLILVKKIDSAVDIAILNSFRDSVPAALRAHMQLFNTPDVLSVFAESGRMGAVEWAGEHYWGWEFTVVVTRIPILTAAAA